MDTILASNRGNQYATASNIPRNTCQAEPFESSSIAE
jgi:hypothetical protein